MLRDDWIADVFGQDIDVEVPVVVAVVLEDCLAHVLALASDDAEHVSGFRFVIDLEGPIEAVLEEVRSHLVPVHESLLNIGGQRWGCGPRLKRTLAECARRVA